MVKGSVTCHVGPLGDPRFEILSRQKAAGVLFVAGLGTSQDGYVRRRIHSPHWPDFAGCWSLSIVLSLPLRVCPRSWPIINAHCASATAGRADEVSNTDLLAEETVGAPLDAESVLQSIQKSKKRRRTAIILGGVGVACVGMFLFVSEQTSRDVAGAAVHRSVR